MKVKIQEMHLKLPWIETLDIISNPAPMAPDVALQLQDATKRQMNIRANNAKMPAMDISVDPVVNEFKRETLLHRQAQACVLEGISRLHQLDIVTKRPDTYFAEMAKSDTHMHKVRQNLMAKQAGQVRAEKVRQLRQQKKMGKQLQSQTKQRRDSEKKDMLNQVKRIRKGLKGQDDFVDTKKGGKKNLMMQNKSIAKRNMKNSKYGFGGKKRGNKLNTRESSADFGDYNKSVKGKNKSSGKNSRPGKARRQNFKSKGNK